MTPDLQTIVSDVVTKTTSEVNLFFVLIIALLILFILPFYHMIKKTSVERERMLIAVVKSNTEAITGLKACLEMNHTATQAALGRINDAVRI